MFLWTPESTNLPDERNPDYNHEANQVFRDIYERVSKDFKNLYRIKYVNSNYNIETNDGVRIVVIIHAPSINIILPSEAENHERAIIVVRIVFSGTASVKPQTGESINGVVDNIITLNQWDFYEFLAIHGGWVIIR